MAEATAAETTAPQTNSAPADTATTAATTPGTAPAETGQQNADTTTSTDPATEQAATTANADAKSDAQTDTPTPKAPEQYADFTLPEGYELDPEMTTKFKSLAKELDLTQEQAQKLIALDAERHVAQAQQVQQASAAWLEQTKSDKEIGGAQLAENVAVAQKAFAAFGTPELKALLNQTGLGNHPEIIRAFYRAGKTISEDTFVAGGTATNSGARDAATVLYSKSAT